MTQNPFPQIESRIFLRATFTLLSPLCIGSGEDEASDCDVLRDFDGIPFVPATSICGVMRGVLLNDEARKLLGYVDGKNNVSQISRLSIGDGRFLGSVTTSVRDSVRLDAFHTADGDGKFDCEIVEPGARFVCDMEFCVNEGECLDDFCTMLRKSLGAIDSGRARLGHKANRGFGRLSVYCQYAEYTNETLAESLDFDASDAAWEKRADFPLETDLQNEIVIHAELILDGTLCVRSYPALTSPVEWDFDQLESGGKPVIPGTSWAGALRARCAHILRSLGMPEPSQKRAMRYLFGYIPDMQTQKLRARQNQPSAPSLPSLCVVSESVIEGGAKPVLSRTKVDRFTGGAANSALYTERVQYGGTTNLDIRIHGDEQLRWAVGLLRLALEDLNNGLLPLGGETAIGRGLMRVKRLVIVPEHTEAKDLRALRQFLSQPDIPDCVPEECETTAREVK